MSLSGDSAVASSRSHRTSRVNDSTTPELFADGEVGALMREVDWATTPLGPVEKWPQSLRTVVRILLTSRFAMWMGWGPEVTFLYNDAYAHMTLGNKHPWALGRPSAEVWAEIWAAVWPRIEHVRSTGEATWDEELLLFLERSGYAEETYHTFSYSPLSDDEGAIRGHLCVVTEVTDRVIGERRLTSLRELAATLNTAITRHDVLEAIIGSLSTNTKDLPFTLTYVLDPGGSPATLVCRTGVDAGHTAAPLRIDVDDPNALWPVASILDGREARVVTLLDERYGDLPTGSWDRSPRQALIVAVAQPGQERPAGFFVVGVNPYRPLDDAYADFVGLLADQIESSLANARAYEEERQRAEALAELDRAKTQFFSNVSHEFRTPLTLMLGPTSDLLTSGELAPDDRSRVEVVHRNALRLQKLVNSMLDFSRVEAGRVTARYEATDLAAYTSELASAFRSAIDRAGLQLDVDAPALRAPVYVDRDMWEKVVLNLVSNALKHTFDGTITVRVRDGADSAQLEVRDTGVGIAAAELPRIFDRFHRVPNARSRTHEGTGIGLALVQELVRRHGGRIAVTSHEGEGTAFIVTVPYGTAHLPADHVIADTAIPHGAVMPLGAMPYVEEALRWVPSEESIDRATTASGVTTGEMPVVDGSGAGDVDAPRILLADDNRDMRDYVGRLLRERGWLVEAVGDGNAALEAARARRPDLVLTDVMMPGLDGFALLRALRADSATHRVPVVLLSARAGEEARVEGVAAGADDYLVKPFGAQELLARVATQISLARERERALAAIGEAEERWRTLVARAPVAIATTRGPSHVFETANEYYCRMVSRSAEWLMGKSVVAAFPELDAQDLVHFDRAYGTGEAFSASEYAAQVVRPDGIVETGYFDLVYQPLRENDGTIRGLAIVATDVTARVRAREEVEQALTTAEAASRAKSEFLAVMSHELRTPLNAIAGYTQLMALGIHGPISESQLEALERIDRSQRHLLRLVNDVLNLARIEAGHVDYRFENVPLRELVAELTPLIEPQVVAKGLTCDIRLAESPLAVSVDREKLTQILLNLLTNAVKFTPPGGRVTVDAVTRSGAEKDVFVRVMDTGIGIPREKEDAIFEPFVQVNVGMTRTAEGAGLGLAISRDLARGMGGDVRARSSEGHGSTFTVRLARAADDSHLITGPET
jgi:PAS domain S-box-containing protein